MLNIIKLKGCKRCGGNLCIERDMDSHYVYCLQCSATYVRRVNPEIKRTKVSKALPCPH